MWIIVEPIIEDSKIGKFTTTDLVGDFRFVKGRIFHAHPDMLVKAGEVIKYDKRAGDDILVDDVLYKVITQRDVMYVVNEA